MDWQNAEISISPPLSAFVRHPHSFIRWEQLLKFGSSPFSRIRQVFDRKYIGLVRTTSYLVNTTKAFRWSIFDGHWVNINNAFHTWMDSLNIRYTTYQSSSCKHVVLLNTMRHLVNPTKHLGKTIKNIA